VSSENVEIVRRAFAEFERGNFWVPEFFDPDIRIVWLDAFPVGEAESVGLEALSQGMKRWLEPFEDVTTRAERIIDAGDQVVVVAAWRGRGKASGVEAEWRYGGVWTVQDGKVTSMVSYLDPAEALKAAGVEE
jgi:ketosteroid isomerase-like protein